jgi:hypothetical protein
MLLDGWLLHGLPAVDGALAGRRFGEATPVTDERVRWITVPFCASIRARSKRRGTRTVSADPIASAADVGLHLEPAIACDFTGLGTGGLVPSGLASRGDAQ